LNKEVNDLRKEESSVVWLQHDPPTHGWAESAAFRSI
jgi:hypothetical protein